MPLGVLGFTVCSELGHKRLGKGKRRNSKLAEVIPPEENPVLSHMPSHAHPPPSTGPTLASCVFQFTGLTQVALV